MNNGGNERQVPRSAQDGRSGKAPGTMHWSYPGAVRVLGELCRRQWSATTWALLEACQTVAVHSDIASVRGMFQALGFADWRDSVECIQVGWSGAPGERGRRKVYRYTVPGAWRARCVRILRYAEDHTTAPGHRPDLAVLARVVEAEGQLALFS